MDGWMTERDLILVALGGGECLLFRPILLWSTTLGRFFRLSDARLHTRRNTTRSDAVRELRHLLHKHIHQLEPWHQRLQQVRESAQI